MSSANRIPGNASLKDILDLLKKDIMLSLNCHAIATVQTFDAANQTITATMNYSKTYIQADPVSGAYGEVAINYPLLVDCPVVILKGGDTALTFPIKSGDACLIFFNDRDIDNWFKNGVTTQPPNSARLHAFSDGIAMVGLNSLVDSISSYDQYRANLSDGTCTIALGKKNGVGLSLIELSNATITLGQAITQLNTALIAAFGGPTPSAGNPLSPAAVAAYTAFQTQIAGLLK